MDTTPGSAIGGASSSSEYGVGGISLTATEVSAIAARLSASIDPSLMKLRTVGGGKQAAYLPADEIFGVANESFGFHRWACNIKDLKLMHATREDSGQWTIAYMCTMRVTFFDNGKPICFHEDVGYGTAERQPKADAAFELAVKSAVTDARKRCLRLFGPILGQNINSADFQKAAQDIAKSTSQQHQQQQQYSRGIQQQQGGPHGPPALRSVPSSSSMVLAPPHPPTSHGSTSTATSFPSSSSSSSSSSSTSLFLPTAHPPQPVLLQQQISSEASAVNSSSSTLLKGGGLHPSASAAAAASVMTSSSSTPPGPLSSTSASTQGGDGLGLDENSKKRRAEENRLAAIAKRQKLGEQKVIETSSTIVGTSNGNVSSVSALPHSTLSPAVVSDIPGGTL